MPTMLLNINYFAIWSIIHVYNKKIRYSSARHAIQLSCNVWNNILQSLIKSE